VVATNSNRPVVCAFFSAFLVSLICLSLLAYNNWLDSDVTMTTSSKDQDHKRLFLAF